MLSRPKSGYRLPPIFKRDVGDPRSENRPSPMAGENVREDWRGESREQLLAKSDSENMLPDFVRQKPRAYLVPPRRWRGGIQDTEYTSHKRKRDYDAFSVKSLHASLMESARSMITSQAAVSSTPIDEEALQSSRRFSRKRKRDQHTPSFESPAATTTVSAPSAESSQATRPSTTYLGSDDTIESAPSPYFGPKIGVNYAIVRQHWDLVQEHEDDFHEESDHNNDDDDDDDRQSDGDETWSAEYEFTDESGHE